MKKAEKINPPIEKGKLLSSETKKDETMSSSLTDDHLANPSSYRGKNGAQKQC